MSANARNGAHVHGVARGGYPKNDVPPMTRPPNALGRGYAHSKSNVHDDAHHQAQRIRSHASRDASRGKNGRHSTVRGSRNAQKRRYYAVVLAKHGPPGVYTRWDVVKRMGPMIHKRFDTEEEVHSYLEKAQTQPTWDTRRPRGQTRHHSTRSKGPQNVDPAHAERTCDNKETVHT